MQPLACGNSCKTHCKYRKFEYQVLAPKTCARMRSGNDDFIGHWNGSPQAEFLYIYWSATSEKYTRMATVMTKSQIKVPSQILRQSSWLTWFSILRALQMCWSTCTTGTKAVKFKSVCLLDRGRPSHTRQTISCTVSWSTWTPIAVFHPSIHPYVPKLHRRSLAVLTHRSVRPIGDLSRVASQLPHDHFDYILRLTNAQSDFIICDFGRYLPYVTVTPISWTHDEYFQNTIQPDYRGSFHSSTNMILQIGPGPTGTPQRAPRCLHVDA